MEIALQQLNFQERHRDSKMVPGTETSYVTECGTSPGTTKWYIKLAMGSMITGNSDTSDKCSQLWQTQTGSTFIGYDSLVSVAAGRPQEMILITLVLVLGSAPAKPDNQSSTLFCHCHDGRMEPNCRSWSRSTCDKEGDAAGSVWGHVFFIGACL